jgi:diguanylate cyclase (GGDEF)-like protein
MQIVPTTNVPWLVAISILTSIVASYAAFSFAERLVASRGKSHLFWLASGATAMGLGIWSMHYLGMLAVRLPLDVAYHLPTVLLSLLLAILASAVALFVVSRKHRSFLRNFVGSLLMGSGIGAMHYVGMHAMRCTAMHHYRAPLVALSVLVAVVFSYMAIWITSFVQHRASLREPLRLAGALIMGLGIAAMHYTAMAAVTFLQTSAANPMSVQSGDTVHISTLGTLAVVFVVAMVLFAALTTSILDRRVQEQLRKINERLEQERDRFHAAVESSMDCFFLCEAVRSPKCDIEDFVFTYLNKNVEKMVALPRTALIGRRMCEVLPVNRTLGLFARYREVVLTGRPLEHEFSIRDKNVLSSWIRIQAVKLGDGVAITASDITARKLNEQQIIHSASHDPLTGLLNRTLLRERITHAIELSSRNHTSTAVFFLDLDGFKQINDSLGHRTGDNLLIQVAARLRAAIRSTDSVIRLGGDEFVVVIPGLANPCDAQPFGEKLVAAMQQPVWVEGLALEITCSIGGALYPGAATNVDDLLAKADIALYDAKHHGKNGCRIYASQAVSLVPSGASSERNPVQIH